MNYRTFIVTLFGSLVASVLFVISLAEIRTLWLPLAGTEGLERAYSLETDGRRLYAEGHTGVYFSLDDGYAWRYAELAHGLEQFYIIAIGIGPNAVYAGTHNHGVYRSDNHGITWKPKRKGTRTFDLDDPDREPYYAEVKQILVTRSGTVIAVGYHSGAHTSSNRGETWHDIIREWKYQRDPEACEWFIGAGIWSMTEFNGYLWIAHSATDMFRSSDNGETWEISRAFEPGRVTDWAVLDDRLYVARAGGLGQWNEAELAWDDFSQGLLDEPFIQCLALNRGRIFAGTKNRGV